jgi:hypothetical protein
LFDRTLGLSGLAFSVPLSSKQALGYVESGSAASARLYRSPSGNTQSGSTSRSHRVCLSTGGRRE